MFLDSQLFITLFDCQLSCYVVRSSPKQLDRQLGFCIVRSTKEHCLKGGTLQKGSKELGKNKSGYTMIRNNKRGEQDNTGKLKAHTKTEQHEPFSNFNTTSKRSEKII